MKNVCHKIVRNTNVVWNNTWWFFLIFCFVEKKTAWKVYTLQCSSCRHVVIDVAFQNNDNKDETAFWTRPYSSALQLLFLLSLPPFFVYFFLFFLRWTVELLNMICQHVQTYLLKMISTQRELSYQGCGGTGLPLLRHFFSSASKTVQWDVLTPPPPHPDTQW